MIPDVADWLREYLRTNGPSEVNQVRLAAKAAGYTRGDLRDAKLICRIKTRNNWSQSHPFTDRWYWSLPEDDA